MRSSARLPGQREGTHVDEVRDIVDVVFADGCVGGCQVQQVVIPGFCTLQLVFRILGLSLKKQNGVSEHNQDGISTVPPATEPYSTLQPGCDKVITKTWYLVLK